jgi:cyanophycinase-like exopeptidase
MSEGPGLVVLFGSGETSPSGRKVFEWLLGRLASPIRAAVLETPAGFELNSAQVAGRIAEFLRQHLQNYRPQVTVVPARKRNTPFSPDDPGIVAPLLDANLIFLGPGSPTYAVRQLQDSLAWHTLVARHRLGAAIALASAAVIAGSAHTLPVYEIYKAGADLHWHTGLDFFAPYGLSLVFVPHWNNAEGGADLDTSRCFMGQARFEQLSALLPPGMTMVGIDEHTALVIDLKAATCQVMGSGSITIIRGGDELRINATKEFAVAELGPFQLPELETGLPPGVWEDAQAQAQAAAVNSPTPSSEVLALVEERQVARARHDWDVADALREQIAALGWLVLDTPAGPRLEANQPQPGQ